jgi:tetratricopeptide (TPR) repeat protein
MAKTWLSAADEHGIPSSFIIRDGKIAWIGHPMQMDIPLEKITAGQWDPTAMAKTRLEAKSREKKQTALQQKVLQPYRKKDYRATLSALEEVASADPELADRFVSFKLNCLSQVGEVEEAVKCGNAFLKKHWDEEMALNNAFFSLIDLKLEKDPDPRIAKLALAAARRATELSGEKSYLILDTMAVALYRAGDPAGAAVMQEKALKQLEAQVPNRSHPYYKSFGEQLEKFKAAADKAGKAEKP